MKADNCGPFIKQISIKTAEQLSSKQEKRSDYEAITERRVRSSAFGTGFPIHVYE